MLRQVVTLIATVFAAGVAGAGHYDVADRHPVYVGAKVCAECHAGQEAGHQFSIWRASRHAQAYASLWTQDSRKIAELSGIKQEPQEAAMCLGCHATASDTEDWEREDSFVLRDGVQCETCHGPGSEYIDADIMADRDKAMAAGLRMPDQGLCLKCHAVKGSHVAVMGPQEYDLQAAWKTIAHPRPGQEASGSTPAPSTKPAGTLVPSVGTNEHDYVGVMACAECHQGPAMGYQFSKWRLSAHARAYATLGTSAAYEMASREGVPGDPQRQPQCLRCHATNGAACPDSATVSDLGDGVGCESCHGPGSDYSPEAVMRDPRAAALAGLTPVTQQTCDRCHGDAHGRPFEYQEALVAIAHPKPPDDASQQTAALRYKTPLNLATSPDGTELYVACEASDTVIVVNTATRQVAAEIQVGGQPNDVTFSPDGRRAYVSNRLDDSMAVIDTQSREVLQHLAVGDEPHGVLTDRSGQRVYVLNTSADSISVIDSATMEETKRLAASRSPWSLAISPDGKHIAATNTVAQFVKFRTPPVSEVTLIDTQRAIVEHRIELPGVNLLQGIDWHPSGEFALVTLNRTKNLVPMTRLLQGWTITNGLGVVWRSGRVDQVLLDEPSLYFPDPADVAISPDGSIALVTSSGSDRVAVIDIGKLLAILDAASPYEREHVLPNHLGRPTEFIVKHLPTRHSPRGVTFAPDGQTAFVANALDDSLTVIDVTDLSVAGRIDLGGPREITKIRRGERVFHSADSAFQRQFSCHTCHPDGHVNGLTFDIEPDGIGAAPVDNRTLRGIVDTAPFKWEGTNPSLQRQCGPRLAVFFTRINPFTPEELSALDTYICTIPRPPNRHRPLGADLTPAQRRGKLLFERSRTNDGRVIPEADRCISCHFPPLYTDRLRHDVGTKMPLDHESDFDVPHLNNIYDSAPYLHNGIADTLEEIWTVYNPEDRHGITNDMTKDQLNDLIEYLKTL